jgi:hypothetical protein
MRYAKGSIDLHDVKDKAILRFVADSSYVTHSQLYEFARLDYYEYNRPVFNWRIRRMVAGKLVRKQFVPILHGEALYSINRAGIQALERLGTYYLGANLEGAEAHEFQVPHALEVNNIRLALLRTGRLWSWVPESLIRILNVSPVSAYAKVYDGIAEVNLEGRAVKFAVEYERTLKSPAKYEKIPAAIEAEKRLNIFLYLVPALALLFNLTYEFQRNRQLVVGIGRRV